VESPTGAPAQPRLESPRLPAPQVQPMVGVMEDCDQWWYHQDQLMQQLEEQERIDACNEALSKYTQETHDEPV
jgi:hypothetical protein